ncbi:MAG: 2-oxo acid dehydrogenase subunit E2 [Geobacter sp.]|nr:2-oxo acid dehydrogenase subunit E2 [Geobacter sp.]
MAFALNFPDLGEGIVEAELRKWLVKPGDKVVEHQPLVEVETDKAVVDIPSPRAGTIGSILRQEGETDRVGELLLTILDTAEEPSPSRKVGIVGELPEAPELSPSREGEVRATPQVRKLARERGIDLQQVTGSGPRGSISLADLESSVQLAGAAVTPDFGPVERQPLKGLRRTIARNVLLSQREAAAVTVMEEVDLTELWELRQREQPDMEAMGTHLTMLPFFIKATQHALKEFPRFNAAIDSATETVIIKQHYHFGIAVETGDGLMVPVLRDVDRKSIIDLAGELQRLEERARTRTIALEELQGNSFTITNYGHYGGLFATPIINRPDVAILGFGRIAQRPWVHQGELAIRRILPLSLTFDHRISDGADAARFLAKVVHYLEDPARLFIESV